MHHAASTVSGMGFPARYVQGANALALLEGMLGDCLNATSATLIYDGALTGYLPSFTDSGLFIEPVRFPGTCSESVVQTLSTIAAAHRTDCVIGFGGGKTLDTAKAVAANIQRPLVIIPSAASSDAPTSRLVALYDGHTLLRSCTLRKNPDVILVDTTVLMRAPRRLMLAGIGDALSKRFEVDLSVFHAVPNTFGLASPGLARLLADNCYALIRAHASEALREHDAGVAGHHFERLVEACVLYSGLAFEGGGLSLAHGLLRGLTTLPGTENFLHGELVAYGTLIQLLANSRQREHFDDVLSLIRSIGLPSCLRDIGVRDLTDEAAHEVARLALTAPYLAKNAQNISPNEIVNAIRELETCSSKTLV